MSFTDLADLIEPLKRELAVPGTFDTAYPDTDDDALFGALADGFGEAKLDGFFSDTTLDLVEGTVDPEISDGGGALIVIYSAMRILRAQMRSVSTSSRYKAGNVEYETNISVNVMVNELKALVDRKNQLIAAGRSANSTVYVTDVYWDRQCFTFNYGEIC